MINIIQEFKNTVYETNLLPQEVTYQERLQCLFEVGKKSLSLAKLAEAHWDALSILNENRLYSAISKPPLYAVWASENPENPLKINLIENKYYLSGTKMFCSGSQMVDRALISVEGMLIDIELNDKYLSYDSSFWTSRAFEETNTYSIHFHNLPFSKDQIIGEKNWYTQRKGFWIGALGPAACWGGGAAGLVNYAKQNKRQDPHTLAHLAAMESNIWAIDCILKNSAILIDNNEPINYHLLALKTRHCVENLCTDILRRFTRAYGPFPITCDAKVSKRYQELDIYLRQNHAERDLEQLGKLIHKHSI